MADFDEAMERNTVYGWRARLGVIVPTTNTVNEVEWNRMAPEGVTVHSTRMPLHEDTAGGEGRRALHSDIERASQDLARAGVDVLALDDDVGMPGTMMISPGHWREFFKPRLATIIQAAQAIKHTAWVVKGAGDRWHAASTRLRSGTWHCSPPGERQ